MPAPNDSYDVRHEPDRSRFVVQLDGAPATAEYRRSGDTLVLTHTAVPSSAAGEGVGSALARAALAFARQEKLRVVPRCRFMAVFVRRHPEFRDLVD
jgi:uncharacterized protein